MHLTQQYVSLIGPAYCMDQFTKLAIFLMIFFLKWLRLRPDDKPWYNSEIRQTSRKRDRLKSKAIKTGKISDWNSYKKLWNKVNNQKKRAEISFILLTRKRLNV